MSRLVLTRRLGQEILIDHPDGRIVVCATDVGGHGRGRRVVLAIDAPRSVSVLRRELVERREREAR